MFATTILGYTIASIWLVLIASLWVFIAIWPALMAQKKGRSFWLFFLASLLFWWITFFVVIFMKDESSPPTAAA